ncbi:MAG TPA: 16S rRNA (cytidine(1402)-2'-O)-methyltransferase [Nevskiaceae bacterium]|nr:16S rRNA (cytidine(1402)-2'-O)-methyltransferase [Nevskiaceae bacterium]
MSETSDVEPGTLYVVATPIGHLGDFSPRAQRVLGQVSLIGAEDTRTSQTLLSAHGIRTPLQAVHEHNEAAQAERLLARLRSGESLALIADAGTPLISDPGFTVVRAARAAGVPVRTVPGPCAAIAALSIAGLPSDRFEFVGFLPAREAARRERLRELAGLTHTWIVYESSHRIEACLADLLAVLGPARRVCLARELTKQFEQSELAPLQELLPWLRADPHRQRGEFVLVVEGAAPVEADEALPAEAQRLLELLLTELPASRAARLAAAYTGLPRQRFYRQALGSAADGE